MTTYRCYFLDENDRIKGAENIDADKLSEAIGRAQAMLYERPQYRSIEIWDGAKRVYPDSSIASPPR